MRWSAGARFQRMRATPRRCCPRLGNIFRPGIFFVDSSSRARIRAKGQDLPLLKQGRETEAPRKKSLDIPSFRTYLRMSTKESRTGRRPAGWSERAVDRTGSAGIGETILYSGQSAGRHDVARIPCRSRLLDDVLSGGTPFPGRPGNPMAKPSISSLSPAGLVPSPVLGEEGGAQR